MHRQTFTFTQARLGAFLADHVGTTQRDDVGPLLGQAMVLYDSAIADLQVPAGWHEAMNAALCGASSPQ